MLTFGSCRIFSPIISSNPMSRSFSLSFFHPTCQSDVSWLISEEESATMETWLIFFGRTNKERRSRIEAMAWRMKPKFLKFNLTQQLTTVKPFVYIISREMLLITHQELLQSLIFFITTNFCIWKWKLQKLVGSCCFMGALFNTCFLGLIMGCHKLTSRRR